MMTERFCREAQRLLWASFFFAFLMMFVRLGFVALRYKFWSFSFSELGDVIYYGAWIDWRYLHLPIISFFLFVTLPGLLPFSRTPIIHRLSMILMGAWTLFFIIVAVIRTIYFGYFKSAFNLFIFQSQTEDPWLLLGAVHHDYPFWWVFPGILTVSFALLLLWRRLDNLFSPWPAPSLNREISLILSALLLILPATAYGTTVYERESQKPAFTWEEIDILPVSPFAREAILNDFESFERAKEQYKTYWNDGITEIPLEELRAQFALLKTPNNPYSHPANMELYLERKARGAAIPKPSHIFIIVGEAYSQWPLLDKYQAYHLGDGMRSIIAKPNSAWIQPFLSNGTYTSASLIPIITGFTGIKSSPIHEPETYRHLYGTSLAPQLSQLGYKSHFWYGGPGNWEEVRPFVLAQGFTDFHGIGDPGMPPAEKLSYWGAPDKDLFASILSSFPDQEPTVNVILTTSNHAPYNIDLKKEGFHREELRKALPPEWQSEEEIITQLGHYWYADREMTKFILEMQKKYPQSLFIITGDHMDRLTRKPIEGLFEWETIPFIIYGPGIHQELFPKEIAGSQLNIIPTLIELIAPKDFVYYSLAPSLTLRESCSGFSSQSWITPTEIGKLEENFTELLPQAKDFSSETPDFDWNHAATTYTWWRINRGKFLEEGK